MLRQLLVPAVALAVLGSSAGLAYAQAKKKGAIIVTPSKCKSMCHERGHARRLGLSCDHLCRPGCRNAATGERFCVR
jgi:hypothetical protein